MLYSLLVKLAMLGLTLGVVLWIGWAVPHSRYVEAERSSELGTLQDPPLRSSSPLAVSEAAFSPRPMFVTASARPKTRNQAAEPANPERSKRNKVLLSLWFFSCR